MYFRVNCEYFGGILRVPWVMVVMMDMLGIHWGALAYIAFERILVYNRSTLGYIESILGVL